MNSLDIHGILDMAIRREQAAHDLYAELAETVTRPALKKMLLGMAKQELGHRTKLEVIRDDPAAAFAESAIEDLGMAECVQDVETRPDMNYRDILAFAMKAEDKAQVLYLGLAGAAGTQALRETFLGLAREEGVHKHRFEIEYQDLVFGEGEPD